MIEPFPSETPPPFLGLSIDAYQDTEPLVVATVPSVVRPPLRPAYPTEAVDPFSILPDPGRMGQLYIDMREHYPDGMSLAAARPRRPYDQIVADYVRQSSLPGFSP